MKNIEQKIWWSMAPEIGYFLLILAFVFSLYQGAVLLFSLFHKEEGYMLARLIAILIFILVGLSFFLLVYAYIISDFSVFNVALNSHSEEPLFFKISAVWGNYAGSMLLWILFLTFFTAIFSLFHRKLPVHCAKLVLISQCVIVSVFLCFILFTSNPFQRLDPPALQGNGLNPILQDMSILWHPPLLYLGYVGFSISFSFSIAALIEGKLDSGFCGWIRPWVLVSWSFLTAGIISGSYWAYYELGWGGYWFWDPVENVSLMPWLSSTALLHSIIVLEKKKLLKKWTLFLAIITFSLCLLGTLISRSNLLTSVHSFATYPYPSSALVLLFICSFLIGCTLFLFAFRAHLIKETILFQPFSREGALIFNNCFLIIATGIIFLGTLFPLFLETFMGIKIAVGATFFNLTFCPLMLLILGVLPLGPFLSWSKGDIFLMAERLWLSLAIALAVFFYFYITGRKMFFVSSGLGIASWVVAGSIAHISRTIFRTPFFSWKRSISFLGSSCAHLGVGITLFGILSVSGFTKELLVNLRVGDIVFFAGKYICFQGYDIYDGPNYQEYRLHFVMMTRKGIRGNIVASRRFFPLEGGQTTEVGLLYDGLSQYYIVVVGDALDQKKALVHIFWKPHVLSIWLGGVFMILGVVGFLSCPRDVVEINDGFVL